MGLTQVIEAWKSKPIEEILREMYIDKNMTILDISKELHISVGAVHKYLSKFHISKQNDLWILK